MKKMIGRVITETKQISDSWNMSVVIHKLEDCISIGEIIFECKDKNLSITISAKNIEIGVVKANDISKLWDFIWKEIGL